MTVDDRLKADLTAVMRARHGGSIVGGGSGPHDPGMEARVAALEDQARQTRDLLNGMERTLVRIEATMATKADIAGLTAAVAGVGANVAGLASSVGGVDRRLTMVEASMTDVVKAAVGKAIGPLQLPAIIAACGAAYVVLSAAYHWLTGQAWMGR